jgi:transposase-like protein
LLPPESAEPEVVSRDVGVSVDTLERWRAVALTKPAAQRVWTAAARLEAVIATAALDEASRSAWCREHGVYAQQLQQWRDNATQALPRGPMSGATHRGCNAVQWAPDR